MRSSLDWLEWHEKNLLSAMDRTKNLELKDAVLMAQHGQPRILVDIGRHGQCGHTDEGQAKADQNGDKHDFSINFGVKDEMGQPMYPQTKLVHMKQEENRLEYTIDLSDLPSDAMYVVVSVKGLPGEPSKVVERRTDQHGRLRDP